MTAIISQRTSCGRILKIGDSVKLGRNGTTKLPGFKVGKVILRRNKKTGFTTHRADALGSIWVKFGKRKDNTEKIVTLMPGLLEWVKVVKKKRGKSVNKDAELENMDFSGIVFDTSPVVESSSKPQPKPKSSFEEMLDKVLSNV